MPDNKILGNPFAGEIQMPRISDKTLNPAEWAHRRIVDSIIDFEKELDADKEIGARLVSFANSEIIHIQNVGYWGPDLIFYHGVNESGEPVQLIQHVSQTNVLLVAVEMIGDEPRRIGFDLRKDLEDSQDDDG